MIELHETLIGDPTKPMVVMCHGLFGQGKNWTNIAKQLTDNYCVLLLDMPNHGRSPWTDSFSYATMSQDVADYVMAHHSDKLPCIWVGHSMGGKVVMRIALTRPELVSKLSVVDMSPARTGAMVSFGPIFAGITAIDVAGLRARTEADAQLKSYIPDPVVRAFILQNLRQDHGQFRWQPNIALLKDSLDALSDWPPITASYAGPVLWIAGANSNYVQASNARSMRALFPAVSKVVIKDAGHWVHSEQPAAFVAVVTHFLSQ